MEHQYMINQWNEAKNQGTGCQLRTNDINLFLTAVQNLKDKGIINNNNSEIVITNDYTFLSYCVRGVGKSWNERSYFRKPLKRFRPFSKSGELLVNAIAMRG